MTVNTNLPPPYSSAPPYSPPPYSSAPPYSPPPYSSAPPYSPLLPNRHSSNDAFVSSPVSVAAGVPPSLLGREITVRSTSGSMPTHASRTRAHNPYESHARLILSGKLAVFDEEFVRNDFSKLERHHQYGKICWDQLFGEEESEHCPIDLACKIWKDSQQTIGELSLDQRLCVSMVFMNRLLSLYTSMNLSRISPEGDQVRREKTFALVSGINQATYDSIKNRTNVCNSQLLRMYLGRSFRCQTVLFDGLWEGARNRILEGWSPGSFFKQVKDISAIKGIPLSREVPLSCITNTCLCDLDLKAVLETYSSFLRMDLDRTEISLVPEKRREYVDECRQIQKGLHKKQLGYLSRKVCLGRERSHKK